jgi:hypothetical protein
LIWKVFRTLSAICLDFTPERNWTSGLRKHAFPGLPTWNDKNSKSDFIYHDREGILAPQLNLPLKGPQLYLIEVKSSMKVENSFIFSGRQLTLVSKITGEPNCVDDGNIFSPG